MIKKSFLGYFLNVVLLFCFSGTAFAFINLAGPDDNQIPIGKTYNVRFISDSNVDTLNGLTINGSPVSATIIYDNQADHKTGIIQSEPLNNATPMTQTWDATASVTNIAYETQSVTRVMSVQPKPYVTSTVPANGGRVVGLNNPPLYAYVEWPQATLADNINVAAKVGNMQVECGYERIDTTHWKLTLSNPYFTLVNEQPYDAMFAVSGYLKTGGGGYSSLWVRFTPTITPPVLTPTLTDGQTVNALTSANEQIPKIAWSDPDGLDKSSVVMTVNGQTVTTNIVDNGTSGYIQGPALKNGIYTVTVNAKDKFGNQATKTYSFTLHASIVFVKITPADRQLVTSTANGIITADLLVPGTGLDTSRTVATVNGQNAPYTWDGTSKLTIALGQLTNELTYNVFIDAFDNEGTRSALVSSFYASNYAEMPVTGSGCGVCHNIDPLYKKYAHKEATGWRVFPKQGDDCRHCHGDVGGPHAGTILTPAGIAQRQAALVTTDGKPIFDEKYCGYCHYDASGKFVAQSLANHTTVGGTLNLGGYLADADCAYCHNQNVVNPWILPGQVTKLVNYGYPYGPVEAAQYPVKHNILPGHATTTFGGEILTEEIQNVFRTVTLSPVAVTGATWVAGKYGNALSFDGVDDYAKPSDATIPATSNYTIEFWVKRAGWDARSNFNAILGWGNLGSPKFEIAYRNDGGNFYFGGWGSDNYTSTPFPLNTWNHVAAVVTNDVVRLYVNGNDTGVNKDISAVAKTNFYIGRTIEQNNNLYNFNGAVDDVRIWNTARSLTDIKASMNKELTGREEYLTNYWQLNETSGASATDSISSMMDKVVGVATSPSKDSCLSCHSKYLTREHFAQKSKTTGLIMECATCHLSTDPKVSAAIKAKNTQCSACHVTADHESLHPTGLDSKCQTCHAATITSDHVNRKNSAGTNFTCDTCHLSTRNEVSRSIKNNNLSCGACHSTAEQNKQHKLNLVDQVPSDIPLYSGYIWTSPLDGSLFTGEPSTPSGYENGQMVMSNRRADVTVNEVLSYYLATQGWTIKSGGSVQGNSFVAEFEKAGRFFIVKCYKTAMSNGVGTEVPKGYRVEVWYK